jgi:PBP1b-binding outer membrane lipoprotein LpoB
MVLRAVKNESVFRFDAETISDQLRHLLIENAKGRIRFVERSRGGDVAEFDPAVLAEREMKREGMVDRGESKALAGADFFLTGTVRSHTVVTGGGRDDTTFFFFILEDAETGELAWEHSYGPIRKVTEKGKAYR